LFKIADFLHPGVFWVEKLENDISFLKFESLMVEKSKKSKKFDFSKIGRKVLIFYQIRLSTQKKNCSALRDASIGI